MFEKNGYDISILSDFIKANVNEYMQLLKFPDGINPEGINDLRYEHFFKQYSIKTYIPLINFPTSESSHITQIRDEFLSSINSIIKSANRN